MSFLDLKLPYQNQNQMFWTRQQSRILVPVNLKWPRVTIFILGLIDETSHDSVNLWDVEGQVLDDSKNNNITKEDDGDVNLISNREIPIHDYTL